MLVLVKDAGRNEFEQLQQAVVDAFPRYVWERLDELGVVAGSAVDAAVGNPVSASAS